MEDLKKEFQNLFNNELDDKLISFPDILLLLARHLKIILGLPAIFCLLSVFYVLFLAKPVYISSSKIMSSSNNSNSAQATGLAAQFGISLSTGQSEEKWVYPEIIKSRTLAKSMLKRYFSTLEFGQKKKLIDILNNGQLDLKSSTENYEAIAVQNFLSMINIDEDLSTSILTLSISAAEASFAKDINQALIEELDAHQRNYNKLKTSKTKIFIQERIVDIEKELISAEERLKIFMDRNRRIENSPSLQLEQQRLSREVTVLIGVFTTLKQQLETTKIEEVKESSYVVIIDAPEKPLIRSKPNKKMIVILNGIFGISLGLFFAFISEYLLSRKKDDIEKINKAKITAVKNILYFWPSKKIK